MESFLSKYFLLVSFPGPQYNTGDLTASLRMKLHSFPPPTLLFFPPKFDCFIGHVITNVPC